MLAAAMHHPDPGPRLTPMRVTSDRSGAGWRSWGHSGLRGRRRPSPRNGGLGPIFDRGGSVRIRHRRCTPIAACSARSRTLRRTRRPRHQGGVGRAGVSPDQGRLRDRSVIQAGAGQNAARQAPSLAHRHWTSRPLTINSVWPVGINAIALPTSSSARGSGVRSWPGACKSMTRGPHLLPKSRSGLQRRGHARCHRLRRLADAFDQVYGVSTEGTTRSTTDPRRTGHVRRAVPPTGGWAQKNGCSTTRSSRSRSRSVR